MGPFHDIGVKWKIASASEDAVILISTGNTPCATGCTLVPFNLSEPEPTTVEASTAVAT